MVAYSFQKRFVGHIQAGLEPGPWCPGMKRHTLRLPRTGRQGHARPEQPMHLYTGMRTRQCRLIGRATARVQIPVTIGSCASVEPAGPLILMRREGPAPRSKIGDLAPIVLRILALPPGAFVHAGEMEEFARTDGFRDLAEMVAFFDPPAGDVFMDMILVGWSPEDR